MSKNIFQHKVIDVKKVGETENGFAIARFMFDDGDTVEAAVQFMNLPEGGDEE